VRTLHNDALLEKIEALRQQLEDLEVVQEAHYREDGMWIDRLQGLLAAISVVLVVLSLLLALAAIVGWGRMEQFVRDKVAQDSQEQREAIETLRGDLRHEAQERLTVLVDEANRLRAEVQTLMKDLDQEKAAILSEARAISNQASEELQGRLRGSTALVLGRLSRDPDNYLRSIRKDLLDRAIDAAEISYQQLTRAQSVHRWNALNNLVFYRALRGDDHAWEQLIGFAEELRKRVEEGMDKPHFLSTYVRVLGEFAWKTEDPARCIKRAEEVLEGLLKDEALSERLRKEARQYTKWLDEKKRSLEGE
jgi:hypothetical protein